MSLNSVEYCIKYLKETDNLVFENADSKVIFLI